MVRILFAAFLFSFASILFGANDLSVHASSATSLMLTNRQLEAERTRITRDAEVSEDLIELSRAQQTYELFAGVIAKDPSAIPEIAFQKATMLLQAASLKVEESRAL